MDTETKRIEILRLFDENIYPHIIGDLKILDTIQPNIGSNGCTVPTAMLILSTLDLIGYLLRGHVLKLDDSGVNIRIALEYNNYFPPAEYNTDVINTLAIFYRHGIMHTFYPRQTLKNMFGIHKSESTTLLETFVDEGYSIPSLNVNVFSLDFKRFVDKLYHEIKLTTDFKLLDNIFKSFKVIYPENLKTSPTTTTQTTIPFGILCTK